MNEHLIIIISCIIISSLINCVYTSTTNTNNTNTSNNIITLTIHDILDTYNLLFFIGSASKEKYLDLNLKCPFTWTCENFYAKGRSPSETQIESGILSYKNDTNVAYDILQDYIYFEESKLNITDINIYYLSKCFYGFDSFGFGRNINNPKSSLTHILYNKRLITKLQFGIASHRLYLGGFDTKITQNKHATTCNVKTRKGWWSCELTHVYINNNIFINTYDVALQTNDDTFGVPTAFMEYLHVNYFKTYIDNGVCVISNYLKQYQCNCKAMTWPNITLVFGDDGIAFPLLMGLIVDDIGGRCAFKLNVNKEDNNAWELGISFVNQYSILFDYETNQLTFYQNRPWQRVSTAHTHTHAHMRVRIRCICYTSVIVVTLCWSIFLYMFVLFNNIKL